MPPKYQQVLDKLTAEIAAGKYAAGQKLPSEAALVKQFGTSRITVGHALRELTHRGMIERIAGSGSYVKQRASFFGLLIPELERTEIFGPISRGIPGSLLWGSTAREFIERRVAGVFWAPRELDPGAEAANVQVAEELDRARIPIVLLDRDYVAYPERSSRDLVGIDNRRAGFLAADHLLRSGASRIHFLAMAGGAPTVDARIAGFREAAPQDAARVHRVTAIAETPLQAGDGFVCANDWTAGELMHLALAAGFQIPRDIRIVGIDDVEYATLLPVPLTTVHQPCREIGEAAMSAMLARIERPRMLARDVLVECRLVVRKSA